MSDMSRQDVIAQVRGLLGDFHAQQAEALTDEQVADLGRHLAESARMGREFGEALADAANRQLERVFSSTAEP